MTSRKFGTIASTCRLVHFAMLEFRAVIILYKQACPVQIIIDTGLTLDGQGKLASGQNQSSLQKIIHPGSGFHHTTRALIQI